jgi:transposase
VGAGKTITATAAEMDLSTGALHDWVHQDQVE